MIRHRFCYIFKVTSFTTTESAAAEELIDEGNKAEFFRYKFKSVKVELIRIFI